MITYFFYGPFGMLDVAIFLLVFVWAGILRSAYRTARDLWAMVGK